MKDVAIEAYDAPPPPRAEQYYFVTDLEPDDTFAIKSFIKNVNDIENVVIVYVVNGDKDLKDQNFLRKLFIALVVFGEEILKRMIIINCAKDDNANEKLPGGA